MISQDWTDIDFQSLNFLQLGIDLMSSDTFWTSFLFFLIYFFKNLYMYTMKYHITMQFFLPLSLGSHKYIHLAVPDPLLFYV